MLVAAFLLALDEIDLNILDLVIPLYRIPIIIM